MRFWNVFGLGKSDIPDWIYTKEQKSKQTISSFSVSSVFSKCTHMATWLSSHCRHQTRWRQCVGTTLPSMRLAGKPEWFTIERFQELPVQFFLWRHYAYAALSLGRDKMALGREFTTVESAARWQPLSNFFAGLFAYILMSSVYLVVIILFSFTTVSPISFP